MKIWHVGASASPDEVNGVNYAIWATAQAQVALGHDVSLVVGKIETNAHQMADLRGVKLLPVSSANLFYRPASFKKILADAPDIVHFHSVFIPQQAVLAKRLRKSGIPYIITPHGGTSSYVLFKNLLKKSLYKFFVEAKRFRLAAALTIVLPKEENEVRSFATNYQGLIRFIPNPVDDRLFAENVIRANSPRKQIVYLGRFDIYHKGLDNLADIARALPDADFHLYGANAGRDSASLKQLEKICPSNVKFHPPIYAAEKISVLVNADLYIQTSRWEVFGISIAESMAIGLPCAISETLNFAELFAREKLGIVLPIDPHEAATVLKTALITPDILAEYAARARNFAVENFKPQNVATKYLNCYREVLAQSTAQEAAFDFVSGNSKKSEIGFERQ